MKDANSEVPFFARYLEGQEFPDVKTNVKAGPGGPIGGTAKHPSDGDEDVTMKYPSDDDEGFPDR